MEESRNLLGGVDRLYSIAPIGLCYLDSELRFQYINDWLAQINGLPVESHLGKRLDELLQQVAAGTVAQMQQVLDTGEPLTDGEVIAETPAHPGEKRCYRHSYFADRNDAGEIKGVCCIVQDVTERKKAEITLAQRNRDLKSTNEQMARIVAELKNANEALQGESLKAAQANKELEAAKSQLKRLAFFDNLTGLGNRILFNQQFEQLLGEAQSKNEEVAVLAMDLDGFKGINDSLGHAAGDKVLQEFAARLRNSLRKSDRKYRLGGDEFAVLLSPRFGAFNNAVSIAEKIAEEMTTPLLFKDHSCTVGVSIGIAVYPDHGRDTSVLLRKADAAMYEAKKKRIALAGASDLSATTVLRNLREP